MTERLTVDTINSDQLDALYDRVANAEKEADDSVAAATRLVGIVGKRAEKAEKAVKNHRSRVDTAETELRVLRAGLRANGADPTQIQNLWAQIRLRNRQWRDEKQRVEAASRVGTRYMVAAEKAEAAIARVHEAVDKLCREPHPGHDHVCPDDVRKAVLGALAEPKEG
ncbi:hypothetical protein F3K20_12755 [Streptomyces scabiei]|uniref:hypothetical protein n=1 Tax=Streptomyces scabiei TaxID=1930 RepID=UPI001B305DBF|nr:hypothetical protein [Streptomyces sp. LBUM 1482]QTU45619.1 hypothetical protein F3K20_12755 [Streptomyces sp. LBUM 1482]